MMSNPIDYQAQTTKMEGLGKAVDESTQRFQQTQVKVIDEYVLVVEKIALYSAAIISLSITFFGTMLDKHQAVLYSCFLGISAKWLMLIAWLFLLVSFVSGLFVRWFNATNIFWSASGEYVKSRSAFMKSQVEYAQLGLPMLHANGVTTQEWIEKTSAFLDKEDKNYTKVVAKGELNFKIKIVLHRICFIAFGLGIVSLTFAVLSIVMSI